MKIPRNVIDAMRRYYENWKQQAEKKWDKLSDLKNIQASLPKNCYYFQAMAGTFWLSWKHPKIQTTHNDKNYWCGKILARWNAKEKKFILV